MSVLGKRVFDTFEMIDQKTDFLSFLPNESLLLLLTFLTDEDVISIRLVNKRLSIIALDSSIWRERMRGKKSLFSSIPISDRYKLNHLESGGLPFYSFWKGERGKRRAGYVPRKSLHFEAPKDCDGIGVNDTIAVVFQKHQYSIFMFGDETNAIVVPHNHCAPDDNQTFFTHSRISNNRLFLMSRNVSGPVNTRHTIKMYDMERLDSDEPLYEISTIDPINTPIVDANDHSLYLLINRNFYHCDPRCSTMNLLSDKRIFEAEIDENYVVYKTYHSGYLADLRYMEPFGNRGFSRFHGGSHYHLKNQRVVSIHEDSAQCYPAKGYQSAFSLSGFNKTMYYSKTCFIDDMFMVFPFGKYYSVQDSYIYSFDLSQKIRPKPYTFEDFMNIPKSLNSTVVVSEARSCGYRAALRWNKDNNPDKDFISLIDFS